MNEHIDSNCEKFAKRKQDKNIQEGTRTKRLASGVSKSFSMASAVDPIRKAFIPLSELSRPGGWSDMKGNSMIQKLSSLKTLSINGKLPSLILWGPAGCGKTTLARILGKEQKGLYQEFSAATHNVEDLRKAGEIARNHFRLTQHVLLIINLEMYNIFG
jgi:putative ATPase